MFGLRRNEISIGRVKDVAALRTGVPVVDLNFNNCLTRMGPFRVKDGDLVARKLATEHLAEAQMQEAQPVSGGATPRE